MEGFLLVILVALPLGLFLALGVILVRALFWGERDMAEQVRTLRTWRPPFISGTELRSWASVVTRDAVRSCVADKRTADAALRVAHEVERGAVHAMLPLARTADIERVVPCPESGQGMIGVSVPEVLAIAADLRATRSRAELQGIHLLAVENSDKIAWLSQNRRGLTPPPLPCPLQGPDRVCCTYAVRPLNCLPMHATVIAKKTEGSSGGFAASPSGTSDESRYERDVARGVKAGLSDALISAGMDGRVYELNSALAKALETPDAADRWARGEDVFGSCRLMCAEVDVTSS